MDVTWRTMSCVIEVVKRTRNSQYLLLTQVTISSHQNLALNWVHGAVADDRPLSS